MSYIGSCLLIWDDLSGSDFRPNVTPYAGLSFVSTFDFDDLQLKKTSHYSNMQHIKLLPFGLHTNNSNAKNSQPNGSNANFSNN